MAGRIHDEIGQIRQVVEEKEPTLPASDSVFCEEDRQTGYRGSDHDGDVQSQRGRRYRHALRCQNAGDAQNAKNVEQITADDVSHGELPLSARDRKHGGDQLRKRGADSDDGQADYQFLDTECASDPDRPLHQPVATDAQKYQPREDEKDLKRRWPTGLLAKGRFFAEGRLDFRRFRTTLANRPQDIGDEQTRQQDPIPHPDHALQPDQQQQDGCADHQRHIEPNNLARDGQGSNQRREAEHQEHIGDVASYQVADGKVPAPGQDGQEADRELRCTGTEGDDRQTYHQGADARQDGQGGGSAHQHISPDDQEGQTSQGADGKGKQLVHDVRVNSL